MLNYYKKKKKEKLALSSSRETKFLLDLLKLKLKGCWIGCALNRNSKLRQFVDATAYYGDNKSLFKSWNNFKPDSLFTIIVQLSFTGDNFYFVNDEVRAGCPAHYPP